ncbi:metallophosphoesterase family protein [Yoonia sp. 208BN28-4]|uniref:metallophosphoesterase family protein n=1 Tax=Yoonia sp. 208BN28-4 TaxID=3126505 RepID=UPI0030B7D04F
MIYAIGDIHGQKDMLDQALARITADGGPDAEVVFLGDYTDRGPQSRAVVDTLISGQAEGRNWHFIKGNHDRFFTTYVRTGRGHDPRVASGIHWLNPRLGGTNTLASYGLLRDTHFAPHTRGELEEFIHSGDGTTRMDASAYHAAAQAAVPQAHLDFLDSLPLTHLTDDLLFVHAGLKPQVDLALQDPEDLLWIRDGFLDSTHDFGRLVVHGHTALDYPQHFGNRIDLDGGAGYDRPLIPAVFEGRNCWLLTDQGRVPLQP